MVHIALRSPFQKVLFSAPSGNSAASQAGSLIVPRWTLEAKALMAGRPAQPPKVTGRRSHFQDASLLYVFAKQIFGEVGLRIASWLPAPWEMVCILSIVGGL